MLFKKGVHSRRGPETAEARCFRSILEQDHGGKPAHFIAAGQTHIVIDFQLGQHNLSLYNTA